MHVHVEFTHHRGQLATGRGVSRRQPLQGELTTHLRTTRSGVNMVVQLRGENVMHAPLAELHEARIYCIGVTAMHLRGVECIGDDGTYALQGWLVTPLR